MNDEQADVVIVGARCAGSATAATLARAGRRVVVLERTRFPADTLSTHAMFPNGCAEFQRIGAWPAIQERIKPAKLRHVRINLDNGVECHERFRPVDGIDHGVSIPRLQLDGLLADNAREHGAEVRERCAVERVLWDAGRAAGVECRDEDGRRHRIRARLVIGADGRRSTIAAEVGAWRPYRASRNGRGLVFRYMDDPFPGTEWAETMWQWRDQDSLAFAFPNPGDRIIVLFMAGTGEVAEARRDPEAYWQRKLDQHPGCRRRIEGGRDQTKLRSTGDVVAFFRASSGPGWALAGDAGHFKDPVIGQGMRDALWMGRTLAEAVIPDLDDPAALDRALRRWEAERDIECMPAYHFANAETRVRRYSPVLSEALRRFGGDQQHPMIGDIFQRLRTPQEVFSLPRLSAALLSAARRGPDRAGILRDGLADAATELRIARELRGRAFRSPRTVRGSDHPGWSWPDPPASAAPGRPDAGRDRLAAERVPA